MSEQLALTTDEIEGLADRLDAWEGLSDRDREVLSGVFALAGAALGAAQPEDEVSGFSFTGPTATPEGGAASFQWGVERGGAPAGEPLFLHFNFKLVAVKTVSWSHGD